MSDIPNLEILKLHYLDAYPDSDRPFPEVMEKYVESGNRRANEF